MKLSGFNKHTCAPLFLSSTYTILFFLFRFICKDYAKRLDTVRFARRARTEVLESGFLRCFGIAEKPNFFQPFFFFGRQKKRLPSLFPIDPTGLNKQREH